MKKLFLFLLLLFPITSYGQNVRMFQYSSDVSGGCQYSNFALNTVTGKLFYCRLNNWASLAGLSSTGVIGQVPYFDTTNTLKGTTGFTYDGAGAITLTKDATINGLTVGKGSGSISSSVALGVNALKLQSSNGANTAIGNNALAAITSGYSNVAIGLNALLNLTGTNYQNVAIGRDTLQNTSGVSNTAVGFNTGNLATTGSNNLFLGAFAGSYVTSASNEFYLNTLDQANNAAEKTNSLMYGTFNATPSNQTLRINAAITSLGNLTFVSTPSILATTGVMDIGTTSNSQVYINVNNARRVQIGAAHSNADVIPINDNDGDLGSVGTRWANLYMATGIVVGVASTSGSTITNVNHGFRNIPVLLDGTPTCSGNGCVLLTGSINSSGKLTTTTTGAVSITVTFSSAFTNAPACPVTNETTANLFRGTSTTTTLVISGVAVAGDTLSYNCVGH